MSVSDQLPLSDCNDHAPIGYGCKEALNLTNLEKSHARVRTQGVNRILYRIGHGLAWLFCRLYLRADARGADHIPPVGAGIIVSNHRSFLDPFVLGTCLRRPVYYVAKKELFRGRFTSWLLSSVGAFPVQRGTGDAEMVLTAKAILERGDLLLIFPEGTRNRKPGLGRVKRGFGRLALDTGAPVIPAAVHGTDRVRRKTWFVFPAKVQVRFGHLIGVQKAEHATPQLAIAVAERVWPEVVSFWNELSGESVDPTPVRIRARRNVNAQQDPAAAKPNTPNDPHESSPIA